jgi:DNA-binding transcriptional LysR family regulator
MGHPVDSRQLLALVTLARQGSFTAAARELNVTQPAVSHSIRALEDDVGRMLVNRLGRRVQLTEAGADFVRHAENILREMDAIRLDLGSGASHPATRLRIGASTTACQHILPRAVAQFRARFPGVAVRIEPGDHGRQIELLRAGQVDLAIGVDTQGPALAGLAFTPLFEDELHFLVAPGHRWARSASVPREAIARETLILYDRTSHSFRVLSAYLREERVILSNFIELGSPEAILELAKLGLGAAVLSPWLARAEVRSGLLVTLPLGRRRLRFHWGVAHWKSRRLAHAEQAFIRICSAATRDLGT